MGRWSTEMMEATLVAVPPGAEVTLHILNADVVTVALDAPVLPAAQTEFADAPLASVPRTGGTATPLGFDLWP